MKDDNKLDISSLKNAVNSFKQALTVYDKWTKKDELKEALQTLRASVIQNFEFTYELSWKMMKRWLEMNINAEAVDGVSRRELFRIAAENKLITDVEKWMDFHNVRNKTSHIYDIKIAEDVYLASKEFLPYAKDLVKRLENKK